MPREEEFDRKKADNKDREDPDIPTRQLPNCLIQRDKISNRAEWKTNQFIKLIVYPVVELISQSEALRASSQMAKATAS